MTLTGCTKNQFTCTDGSCVTIEQRCDGKADCQDWSDEEECKAFITFPGYKKFLVPPPIGNETSLIMNISIIIDQIIAIDENNGYFEIKMTLVRYWYDSQLSYQNLKKNSAKNIISTEDMKMMWKPWTITKNIKNVDEVKKTDKGDKMTIIPNSNFKFTRDEKTNIHNTMLFKGSENAISYERQITVNFVCNYNMRWYPFDSQRCTLEWFHAEESITLRPTSVTYSGPKELTQHIVDGVHICSMTIENRPGIIVEVILDRPLFGTILTVFMPTGILLMLSQMVRVFYRDYLDMVIGVNLTLLLVLATL